MVAYKCIWIRIIKTLNIPRTTNAKILRCEFQCQNEHGHDMAKETGIIVWHDKNNSFNGRATANLIHHAENIIGLGNANDTKYDEDYDDIQITLDDNPSYCFNNPEQVAEYLEDIR